jgi:glutamate N-acetyltransferase/amino-acid N-acetyltransferase
MIHPNMATMLGYLLTDAKLEPKLAQELLRDATDLSFNMISVDGDMSTNDCSFLMANGASGVQVEAESDVAAFKAALVEVSQLLAQAIARDGEGSTKLIEVRLCGVPDVELAKQAARGVILSPLVKTAIHGEDPNWGRIVARLGADRVPEQCLERMTLDIQGARIFESGKPAIFDRATVKGLLKQDTVRICIDLHSGEHEATAWGCDLSKRYVDINAEYST